MNTSPSTERPAGSVDPKLVDPKLLEILVCPLCKGKLVYRKDAAELVCKHDQDQ